MWMLRSPGLGCLGFASPLLFYPYKSSDGPIRVGTESAMHPARSESAGHDPSQSLPGPDPSMFVLIRVMIRVTRPDLSQP